MAYNNIHPKARIPEITPSVMAATQRTWYCAHSCVCPVCGSLLEVEAITLAHYCHTCGNYQIPKNVCPSWRLPC